MKLYAGEVRIGESLLLIISKILAKGWIIWFRGWPWDTYLWDFIIGLLRKLRKFHPSLRQNIHTSNGRYKLIVLRICQNGRWSVDIVLRASYVQVIFRHTGFAEKQGGMCWHQILAQSRTYLKWPQMEKCSTWKSFVLSIRTSLKFGPSPSDLISKAEVVFEILRFCIQNTIRHITPPRLPRMEKWSTWIVFVSSKRSILI